jgi:hypothetical protein
MTTLLAPAVIQFSDANGKPYAGGKLWTYIPATTTPKSTWLDAGQLALNTNPITLDAAGRCILYGAGAYRTILNDALGNLVFDQLTASFDAYDSVISPAMQPVAAASTLASALTLLAAGGGDVSLANVTATGTPTARTLAARYADTFNARDGYAATPGAAGNGSTDDTAALVAVDAAAAAAGASWTIPRGTYKVTTSTAFSAPVVFMPGASLSIATGSTVAFNGGLSSLAQKIFTLAGTAVVTINGAKTPNGFPEWWGAVVDNIAIDCQPAINACIVACPNILLGSGTYYIFNTVLHQTPHRNVIGIGGNQQNADTATKIVITSATQTVWLIGPSSSPVSSALYQSNNRLSNVCLDRSVAPNVSNLTASTGLFVQYTVWTEVDEVWCYSHCIAFSITNNSGGKYTNCVCSRTVAGVGGADRYFGFQLAGNTPLTAGFYSLYISKCIVACSLSLPNSYGLYASGTNGINDLFVHQLETSQLGFGAFIQGNGNTSTIADYYNEDIRFMDCTFDACYQAAYAFGSISLYGAITIDGGYAAPFTLGGTTQLGVLYFSNSNGAVTVTNMQALMNFGASCPFVQAINAKSITTRDCIVTEPGSAPYLLTNVTNSLFADQIRNNSVQPATPCVQVSTGTSRNKISPIIMGRAGAWTVGVNITAAAGTQSEYNLSGIDAGCITGGSANKLVYGGTQITSAGAFGTGAIASGVMT